LVNAVKTSKEPGRETLLRMMEQLVLVREFETHCEEMWKAHAHMVGEYHLSLGQEAIAVGACAAVRQSDLICPSIRGMGVYLCRGASLKDLMTTFFDRAGGISGGRWAHWHSPVPEAGVLAQTGMLGSGLVTSGGVALAQKYLKTGNVVIAMLGDGATNTGYFHEGMNFAAFADLPMVVVIENNGYAVSTPISSVVKVKDLSRRAEAYGIPGITVDGNDAVSVYQAVGDAVERARAGAGTTLIECKTYRLGGSTVKDADALRPAAEKEAARRNCPVHRFKIMLSGRGLLTEDDYKLMVGAARARIGEAEHEAAKQPMLEVSADPLREFWPYVEGVGK
jgi:TPP-dependent pyruvate/acetoin dehydrogenase alpha subunit